MHGPGCERVVARDTTIGNCGNEHLDTGLGTLVAAATSRRATRRVDAWPGDLFALPAATLFAQSPGSGSVTTPGP